jgi:hypothetical protein
LPFLLHRGRIAWAAGFVTSIRLAYLAGAAVALLWAPVRGGPTGHLLLRTFDRWDGVWFTRIAEHGYSTPQTAAFFPVYPLVVRAAAWVLRNEVAAGMVVSLASAAASAVLLERIARRRLGGAPARTAVVLFAVYPLAFVLAAAYSDGLFLLFVLLAVDFAERGRAVPAGLAAALAVDTRLLGLALVPTLALILRRRCWPLVFVPAALGLWLLYLHEHFGDWLAFSHAEQRFWHRQPLSPRAWWHAARTVESQVANLLFHLPGDGVYPPWVPLAISGVVDLAALLLAVWLTWVAWRRFGAAYGSYSVVTLALVVAAPSLEQPLESLPRFLLADFPLFLAAAALLERRPRARAVVVVGLAAIGAVATVAFARGTAWIA